MRITTELARFIEGPVMMTVATRDAENRPMIARGSGGHVPPDFSRVDVAVSAHLWPETIANVRDNGMFTATFVQPADYRAFQAKGRAEIRPPSHEEVARAEAYVIRMEGFLTDLGVPLGLRRHWLTARDTMIVALTVDRVFEQTPGPRAGAVVG